jgi:Tfp pilus assembly protein PilO
LRRLGWLIHAGGALCLLAAGVTYHLVSVTYVAGQRERNDGEIQRLESLLSTTEEIRQTHKRRSEVLARLERDAELMRQRIPDQPQEAEFLRQVTQAATDERLRIIHYDRGQLVVKPTHSEFIIRLQCDGDYASICGFLDRLGSLPRVTTVERMDVTAPSGANRYPFDLTLTLYYAAKQMPNQG